MPPLYWASPIEWANLLKGRLIESPENKIFKYKYFRCFDTTATLPHNTPVGWNIGFDRSLKTLHPFSTLAAVIILKRIDFVTSPFFKSLHPQPDELCRLYLPKQGSFLTGTQHFTRWFWLPAHLSGDKRVNKRSDWTLCPWWDVSGDFKPSASLQFKHVFVFFLQNLRCYIVLLSEHREMSLSPRVCLWCGNVCWVPRYRHIQTIGWRRYIRTRSLFTIIFFLFKY